MWFVANVLTVSSRHEGRRTKVLVGRSWSCCTEGNLVDIEWRYCRLKPLAVHQTPAHLKLNEI